MDAGTITTGGAVQAAAPPAPRRPRWGAAALVAPLAAYLAVFYLAPLAGVLGRSLMDPGFTLEHYAALWGRPVYLKVLANTLVVSFQATCACIVVGYPLAYGMAFFGPARRMALMAAVTLPFWISVLVRTYAGMIILGRFGVVNGLLQWLGLADAPVQLLYNRFGVFMGLTYVLLPYAVLPMHTVMTGIDRDLMRAADSLGASPWQAFTRVFLPLSLPGVAAGFLLAFIIGVGAFVTPALMGGPKDTVIAMSIDSQLEIVNDWGFAGALSVVLLATVLGLFALCLRFMGLESLFGRSVPDAARRAWGGGQGAARQAGRGPGRLARSAEDAWLACARATDSALGAAARAVPGALRTLPWRHWLLGAACFIGAAFLVLPLGVIMPIAFSNDTVLRFPPRSMGLGLFESFFASADWMRVTLNSVRVAVPVTILSTVLGTLAAMGLDRMKGRARHALMGALVSPLILPAIANAVAMYFFMAKLKLIGTATGLILAHTVLATPFVVIVMAATLKNRDRTLEQASESLGAGRLATFRHVTLPLIRPGLVTAAIFAFIASFDELITALFVSGSLNATLPKHMWDGIRDRMDPTVAAVAAALVILAVALMALAALLRRLLDPAK